MARTSRAGCTLSVAFNACSFVRKSVFASRLLGGGRRVLTSSACDCARIRTRTVSLICRTIARQTDALLLRQLYKCHDMRRLA